MFSIHRSRLARIAFTASCLAMSLGGSGFAQSVQVFDEAPPIEVLRAIMIPESTGSASRSIVMQRPDMGSAASPVQHVSILDPAVKPAPRPVARQVQKTAAVADAAPAPAAKEVKPVAVGFRINFAFNSAALPMSANDMMDTVAEVMKEAPDIKVRVEGHTDAVGSANYNVDLSERRALAVGEYLVKHGIDPSRIVLVGKGMAEPLTKDPYDAQNRRVQFVRIG